MREIVLAMDEDPAGLQGWHVLARQGVLRGKRVAFLPPEAYGGHKDLNEAWVAGVLSVGEWPALEAADVEGSAVPEAFQDDLWEERAAILEFDADLSRAEAKRLQRKK